MRDIHYHEDFGELYPYSDHKIGDVISYRLEGQTEQGEILWVSCASRLPSGKDVPPRYIVLRDSADSFPDVVYFSDVTMDTQEPTLTPCPYCIPGTHHYKGQLCPRNPTRDNTAR